jgi:Zn finger protein HypA/HybF involved in hydrogenase expression
MPELGLVNQAAAALLDEVGDQVVEAVEIEIGPSVVEDVADNAWRIAVAGTRLETANVTWTHLDDTLRCLDCGREYPGRKADPCPDCAGTGLVVAQPPDVAVSGWK